MAKKKSKLKKLLKGVALAGAAALGANALRNRRAKPLGVSGADKALFTSDAAQMDNTMPGNLTNSMGMDRIIMGPGSSNPRRPGNFYKKGGRVGCGIAKKGFGRAMPKGRKK